MLDYIDGMSAEDGKKYLHCLIESAAAGEVITDNPLWEYWLEKSLSAIEETRNKIDIEIDGGYHTTEDQKMKDSIRDDDFREMGYDIFRITNDEVNSGKALGMIKDFYKKRQIATTFNV